MILALVRDICHLSCVTYFIHSAQHRCNLSFQKNQQTMLLTSTIGLLGQSRLLGRDCLYSLVTMSSRRLFGREAGYRERLGGWRDDSTIKSTVCPCKGAEFNSGSLRSDSSSGFHGNYTLLFSAYGDELWNDGRGSSAEPQARRTAKV